ncbi:thiamine pyrophosphate-binding protein [Pelomonas aquatica]|jgi:acetolactate synthase-1/2/3 large subunit|uniref:Thiamine pyrophosphate-binding protein n=1 Tax=Pelomonas aquatica TaxID=431058 RepID=A0A9X4R3N1_9BURK|nr:thiamine pyrophosphate-binding protein [Pelomonas aquatica]MCY4753898.1 thiamine pyrophosphate-binding protein [Pelomonas aquatica]MDG0861224.1 thiamine pyrophosphate-binding protein [Pelomonas aquatica]
MTTHNTPRLAGHKLVEALIAQGVDTAFGVPGESYLAVLDGFHEYREQIRFVACRQEGGAAFMAEAQGKLTGRPGICFVTRGPGATNASIGLHTAFQDSTPMILFIGQVASDQRDREAFQEVDYRQMFGPGTLGMAKWVGEVHDAERLPEYVARAFHTAMQGRPGPVVLVLPEDMLTQPIAAPVLPPVRPAEAAPTPAALAELRTRLAAAKRPFVIAGGGGWTPESTAALQRFAESWNLPVGCAFRFQDLFDNAHPNYAGDVGIGINPKLAARVKEADLILAIGPRLGEMTTGGYTLLQAPRPAQQLIHIHAGAEELGRVYTAELLINASMSTAAPALAKLAPPVDIPWRAWAEAAHADYEANLVSTPVAPLDMAEVIRLIDAKLPEGTIFTNGAGNYSGWLHRFHRYTGLHRFGKTQLAPTSGAMGYGVPAAVAAALLQQERWVVNIAGDGDFLMTGQELATATGYGAKKLLVVVVDNGTYGTIRMHQEREYPGRVSGSDLFNPDFAKLAEAFGFAAFHAESTAQVGPALGAAIAGAKPALLHLRLSSDVSTSRATLTAIREAAQKKAGHA